MTKRLLLLTLLIGVFTSSAPRAQDKASDESRRILDSVAVFNEVMAAQDKAIPEAILKKAEGIAIFPSMLKAGFVVGGMRGHGILSARRKNGTWTPPTFMTLTGGSFGLQIGGQAVDLVLVINDRRGVDTFVKNQFKLGADASVAAGPVGREAQAATDLQLRAQILSYSRSRGLFAGVTVNGSTVRADRDANGRFYGTRFTAAQIILDGKGDDRPPVPQWLAALNRYAGR